MSKQTSMKLWNFHNALKSCLNHEKGPLAEFAMLEPIEQMVDFSLTNWNNG
jgi:hypothetical protein